MKRKWYILIIVICLVVGGLFLHKIRREKIHISTPSGCLLINQTGGKNVNIHLSDDDTKAIAELINDHYLYKDALSCGFSEKASVVVESSGQLIKFYIASDGCPFLYSPDNKKYVKLSESEIEVLHMILEAYGLELPCV